MALQDEVRVKAPEGTILNARFPAACGGFAEIRRRTQSVVMGALTLYLDFINMFMFLLQLFGDRR